MQCASAIIRNFAFRRQNYRNYVFAYYYTPSAIARIGFPPIVFIASAERRRRRRRRRSLLRRPCSCSVSGVPEKRSPQTRLTEVVAYDCRSLNCRVQIRVQERRRCTCRARFSRKRKRWISSPLQLCNTRVYATCCAWDIVNSTRTASRFLTGRPSIRRSQTLKYYKHFD